MHFKLLLGVTPTNNYVSEEKRNFAIASQIIELFVISDKRSKESPKMTRSTQNILYIVYLRTVKVLHKFDKLS
jgi:hypothetical protein